MSSFSTLFNHLINFYWSAEVISVNLTIFINLLGALVLGAIVGYERTYNGRAAGVRTYSIVCVASCAITAIGGYPGLWYGVGDFNILHSNQDPTRLIQGITSGIGFLGAGVIMRRDGFSISGLTTAASIWMASAIGVMIGLGFYVAATLLAFLTAGWMVLVPKVEKILPIKQALSVTLSFAPGSAVAEESIKEMVSRWGYELVASSIQVTSKDGKIECRFVAMSQRARAEESLVVISQELTTKHQISNFQLAHSRN